MSILTKKKELKTIKYINLDLLILNKNTQAQTQKIIRTPSTTHKSTNSKKSYKPRNQTQKNQIHIILNMNKKLNMNTLNIWTRRQPRKFKTQKIIIRSTSTQNYTWTNLKNQTPTPPKHQTQNSNPEFLAPKHKNTKL